MDFETLYDKSFLDELSYLIEPNKSRSSLSQFYVVKSMKKIYLIEKNNILLKAKKILNGFEIYYENRLVCKLKIFEQLFSKPKINNKYNKLFYCKMNYNLIGPFSLQVILPARDYLFKISDSNIIKNIKKKNLI